MNNAERRENKEQYINDTITAIKKMVARCGGESSPEGETISLPKEIMCRQRDLFIHSGIMTVLSVAVNEGDWSTIDSFDYILGYHVTQSRSRSIGEDPDPLIVEMFSELLRKVVHDYGPKKEDDDRFHAFVMLTRLSLMALNGDVSRDDLSKVMNSCEFLVRQICERKSQERRQDSEKN